MFTNIKYNWLGPNRSATMFYFIHMYRHSQLGYKKLM